MKVVLHCSECMSDQDQHGVFFWSAQCDIIATTHN